MVFEEGGYFQKHGHLIDVDTAGQKYPKMKRKGEEMYVLNVSAIYKKCTSSSAYHVQRLTMKAGFISTNTHYCS